MTDRVVDFLFEVGMLKRTPRSGWQFLGSGRESVAEHVFRVAMISWVLAAMDGTVDRDRCLRMALAHDLPEARTGDLNYMNQKYVTADEARAAADLASGVPIGDEIEALVDEYQQQDSPEAILVYEADQLEFLLQLKELLDAGNPAVHDWTPFVLERLKTDTGRQLADRILETDSARWWFDRDSEWWVRGGKR